VARRDRDTRPPIEVLGAAPATESVQAVTLGGGRRRWPFVVGGLALLVGGLAFTGSRGGGHTAAPSTTTALPARTTTSTSASTTTTYVPLGPILPVQTGATLLFATQRSVWTVLDLDTGAVREIQGSSGDLYGGLVAVRGGVVIADGAKALYRRSVPNRSDVLLGDAFSVVSSGRDDSIWLVQADAAGQPSRARLVDLTGRTKAQRRIPATGYLAGATVDGPILGDGGQTYLLSADGPRWLGTGNPLASRGDHAVLDACDEVGHCAPVVVDVRSGERREIPALQEDAGRLQPSSCVLADDGELMVIAYTNSGVRLRWVDASGRLIADGELAGGGLTGEGVAFNGLPELLPADQGLVWGSSDGRAIRIRPDGAGGLTVEPVPGPSMGAAERVLVIRS
jgi:hypothetical protein